MNGAIGNCNFNPNFGAHLRRLRWINGSRTLVSRSQWNIFPLLSVALKGSYSITKGGATAAAPSGSPGRVPLVPPDSKFPKVPPVFQFPKVPLQFHFQTFL